MEGCCTVAVSLELSSLFPSLLCLSTKGKRFGSCSPRGRSGAVSVKSWSCWAVGAAGQGWGAVDGGSQKTGGPSDTPRFAARLAALLRACLESSLGFSKWRLERVGGSPSALRTHRVEE